MTQNRSVAYQLKFNRKEKISMAFLEAYSEAANLSSNNATLTVAKMKNPGYMVSHLANRECEDANPEKFVANFCSCSYLGLIQKPALKEIAHKIVDEFGAGYYGPTPLSGQSYHHHELSNSLSQIYDLDQCFIVASATLANMTAIPLLVGPNDIIFSDALNHTTIIDGCDLSHAKVIVYNHNDMIDLEKKVSENRSKSDQTRMLIVCDGVFSMEGDICNLPEIYKIAKKHNCKTMIDECHALGAIGKDGHGTLDYYEMTGLVDVVTGTLGKSLASTGGFMITSKELSSKFKYCSGRQFSASVSSVNAAVANKALNMIKEEPAIYQNLRENIDYWIRGLKKVGFEILPSESALVTIMTRDTELQIKFQKRLYQEGVYVMGINFPAVPRGHERLRTTLMASMTKSVLDEALTIFEKLAVTEFPELLIW